MSQSQLNIQVNALAFSDNTASNNPFLRNFDLTYKIFGVLAKNPEQKYISLPPQSSQVIYDGTRSHNIDNTTQFDVSKPFLDKNIYRFAWNGIGTAPNFRTDRNIGITTATQFNVVINGPIVTLTNSSGPFITANIQVGDILLLQNGSGISTVNQGRFSIIAKTVNSISIQNINGANETFTVTDPTKFLIYSNGGSNNQIQIGDKVIISAGFSLATFGTYEIVEVTPTWFEVSIGSPNGIPLENGITPTASGMVFYKTVKQFILVASQQKVSLLFNDDISNAVLVEPIEPENAERPGLLLKTGSFYKLIVNNNGLNQANIIIATIE